VGESPVAVGGGAQGYPGDARSAPVDEGRVDQHEAERDDREEQAAEGDDAAAHPQRPGLLVTGRHVITAPILPYW
jgi:hypothetical protein